MRPPAWLLAILLAGCLAPAPPAAPAERGAPVALEAAVVDTDYGAFTMVLYRDAAPRTVENFVALAQSGFYDGVPFHRVIDGFVIQTGDPTGVGDFGSPDTVPAEPGLHFAAGAVGMARDADPDSATSQWFVCEYPQPHLHDGSSSYGNFTAFAQVVEGMEVVKAIAATRTLASSRPEPVPAGALPDRPVPEVRIRGVEVREVELAAEEAERLPLRTTARYVTERFRTTLEMPATLRAGEEVALSWYTAPLGGAAPARAAEVAARAPDGTTAAWPAPRDAHDPYVLRTAAAFDAPGTWNLTLAADGEVVAAFDVQVREAQGLAHRASRPTATL